MERLFGWLILSSLLLFCAPPSGAQPQPVLSCVSIVNPTTVEVSWEIPTAPFDGFRLFYGPAGGPFTIVDYPNSTNTTNITVPNVTTTRYEFFLRTFNYSPSSQSEQSNHLETILLRVAVDITGGVAKLDWNSQGDPNMEYTILRSDDNVNFQFLATSSTFEYFDTISRICSPTTLYYKIEHGACPAKSNVVSDLLQDKTAPKDPKLKIVTIENGFAEVHWEPSPSNDVESIVIERQIGPSFFVYQTIPNPASNTFIDNYISDPNFLNACEESITYVVRALDECGNPSPGTINYKYPHSTINLIGNTDQLCERKASLYWNSYNNMEPPVAKYKVERAINGGPFVDIADVPASGAELQYLDKDMLDPGIEVKYRVTAINEDNTLISHSCELSLLPNPRIVTDFVINYVTVTDDSFITLTVKSEPQDVPVEVLIFRSSDGEIDMIETVPWNPTGILTFEDAKDLDVDQSSYTYNVQALDSCGNIIAETQEFNSILLQIGVTNETDVSLLWNDLIGWGSELTEYQVRKYNDGVLVAGYPVIILLGTTNYFETDNSEALKTTYIVSALNTDGTIVNSNEVLLSRDAKVDIPTAFRPMGYNKVFRPVMKNVDSESYLLTIYNRWGQLVFETNNILEGWDGKVNGDIQQGIYIYMVSYKDQAGVSNIKRGSVMLLD
jgi:gliding motility-associated-like protein